MRACFSGACFVIGVHRETQQAFLEAHVAAFGFFGGVFGTLRYDNLCERGQEGAEGPPAGGDRPVRRVALALPVRVASSRARASRAPMRRAAWRATSVGFAASTWCRCRRSRRSAELNERLAAACIADLERTIRGRRETVGEALGERGRVAAALPAEAFDTAEVPRRGWTPRRWRRSGRTSTRCRSRLAGLRVAARIGAREIAFSHDGSGGRPPRSACTAISDPRAA